MVLEIITNHLCFYRIAEHDIFLNAVSISQIQSIEMINLLTSYVIDLPL